MAIDFSAMERKWIERWDKEKVFEANPDSKPKFFVNFPYPYMNSLMHIGHFYTLIRVEAMARYKRMRGYNVLFPQAWHCTGSPIENAAQRIRENEPKQIEIMRQLGFDDALIKEFADPKKWVDYFPKEAEKDLRALGMSIDWRRSFITTSLNPYYDKFIKWQFNKLKEKGYVVTGKHPVVWCTKDNSPVPDHSRVEGEGETPQDFIWIKFRLKNSDWIIMAGTTRPDALYGQSNLWVDPEGEYCLVEVGGEKWVVGKKVVDKIEHQYMKFKFVRDVKPQELIGKWVKGPLVDRELVVLPAGFIDSSVGSGIVYSALEDPVDLFELKAIQSSDELLSKYNLDKDYVKKLKPIDIISVPGMGSNLGEQISKEFGVKSSADRELLEEAKRELNRRVFRKGVMLNNCGFCAGLSVPDAQALLKKFLVKNNDAVMFYELSGKVVCRCLTEAIVKVVSDQWFIKYSDADWKAAAREALGNIKLYPELARQQFEYVINWLNDWPCTREFGLGTNLPWDEKWVIESLSDSTIYMAFYTIAHKLKSIPADKLNDAFFDYVFLGKESDKLLVPKNICDDIKNEFEYWYPVDFRNSGKDLIQNHLAFFIFNHVAIWNDKSKHPKGIGVNGWITVNGEKMSKSKGNFILLRDLPVKYGCDASRFTVLSGGEGIDDANFELSLAESMKSKLSDWLVQIIELRKKGVEEEGRQIDAWFESEVNEIISEATACMDEALFKTALKLSFFEMQRALKWYLHRSADKPSKRLLDLALRSQALMLAPVCPFIAEEAWESLGEKGFICKAGWPKPDFSKISAKAKQSEELVKNTINDIKQIKELTGISNPKKINIYIAPQWKWKAMRIAVEACAKKPDYGALIKALMSDSEIRAKGKLVEAFAKQAFKVAKDFKLEQSINELELFSSNKDFFVAEFGCNVEIIMPKEDEETSAKSAKAFPGKPAILVE